MTGTRIKRRKARQRRRVIISVLIGVITVVNAALLVSNIRLANENKKSQPEGNDLSSSDVVEAGSTSDAIIRKTSLFSPANSVGSGFINLHLEPNGLITDGTEPSETVTESESAEETGGETETETENNTESESETEAPTETEPETEYTLSYQQDPRYAVVKKYQPLAIVTSADGYLHVRFQPSTSSAEIGRAMNGAAFTVVEELGDWLHIQSNGYYGYVAKRYCTMGEDAELLAMQNCIGSVSSKEGSVPAYSSPSLNSDVIATVEPDSQLTLQDIIGDWAMFTLPDGRNGFADADLVHLEYSLSSPSFFYSDPVLMEKSLAIISFAKQYLGGKYKYGAETLGVAVDCSGFVLRVYEHFGINLPRNSAAQSLVGQKISSINEAMPGDLLFYHGFINGAWTKGVGHVAIYLGDGKIIHACSEERGIVIDNYNFYENPLVIRRVITK